MRFSPRHIILAIGLSIVLFMLLFPPWIYVYHFQRPSRDFKNIHMERPAGYAVIWRWDVAADRAYLAEVFSIDPARANPEYFSMRLDTMRLAMQLAAVGALVLLALVIENAVTRKGGT